MPTILWKNLLKLCLPTAVPPSLHDPPSQQDQSQPLPSSSSSAVRPHSSSVVIIKNFNSIYELSSSSTSKSLSNPSTDSFSSSSSSSDTTTDDSPPDFSTVFASQRFFFSSPGQSSSITESRQDTLILPPSHHHHAPPFRGGVAVNKYSPDPYEDFKNSMREMIEARQLRDVRADLDYLHELLSCYLTLNPKHTHKFIISAFADVIIFLLSSSSPESAPRQKVSCRRRLDVSLQL